MAAEKKTFKAPAISSQAVGVTKVKKNPLMEKLLKMKTSLQENACVMAESRFFKESEKIPTDILMLNLALGGDPRLGFDKSGITIIAGPPKHYKTSYMLQMMKAFLNKYDDGVVIFYDIEFGTREIYFETAGVDSSRVLHIPFTTSEDLKQDCVQRADELSRGDNVMICIDSLGNISSKKELSDALKGDDKADMQKAKDIGAFARMIRPYVKIKEFPMVIVGQTYGTMEMFSKQVLKGGNGFVYNADNILYVSRAQEKDGSDLAGFTFTLKVEESRFVKKGKSFPITVMYDGGIQRFSGLRDLAQIVGFEFDEFRINLEGKSWTKGLRYTDKATGECVETRLDQVDSDGEFWSWIVANTNFADLVAEEYTFKGKIEQLSGEAEADWKNGEDITIIDPDNQ